jgi:hypothetical protein
MRDEMRSDGQTIRHEVALPYLRAAVGGCHAFASCLARRHSTFSTPLLLVPWSIVSVGSQKARGWCGVPAKRWER